MKKIGLILVVFAFLVNGASAGQSPEVGDSAPDFNLVSVSGDELKLGSPMFLFQHLTGKL